MATLKKTKNWFQDQLSLNAGQKYCRVLQREHSAILLTFIYLPYVIKILILSIFEWLFFTCSTVPDNYSTLSLSKKDQKMGFKTNYSLMQVKSIVECSKGEHSAILLTVIKLPFVI